MENLLGTIFDACPRHWDQHVAMMSSGKRVRAATSPPTPSAAITISR